MMTCDSDRTDGTDSCDPGDHSLVWSDARLMLVCERCGRSAQTISDDIRSSADR